MLQNFCSHKTIVVAVLAVSLVPALLVLKALVLLHQLVLIRKVLVPLHQLVRLLNKQICQLTSLFLSR